MAEKVFSRALKMEKNKIEINEKTIYNLGISSAHVTNAFIMAVVKDCSGQPIRVDVQYNGKTPQVIDRIEPKIGNKISINITEELNCLIKYAFQYSGNPEHDDNIFVIFDSAITLENIDLYVEYVPNQIMHENSAYVDYDVRKAGSGQINLATGLLRFKHSCGDVGLVYNDWQTENRSTNVYDVEGKKTKYRHGVGKGFKLNVEQFLIKRKGTENQSVYTYVDGDGNYHEFSEKYYYLGENGKKVYLPKSSVQVDFNGKLKYAVDKYHFKEVKVERKTTNGLFLEQDCSVFQGGKYLEQRQKEQIELEENVAALVRQLKQYVLVNKTTGQSTMNVDSLKNRFNNKGELPIANFESFLRCLTADRLLLTEQEAIQYSSLLLQQTIKHPAITSDLRISNSKYLPLEYYSDLKNISKNHFKPFFGYDKKLISLRKLVSDLRKDYATLTKKSEYAYSNDTHYQYDAYKDFLERKKYNNVDKKYSILNCCLHVVGAGRRPSGWSYDEDYLDKNTSNNWDDADDLTIHIGHINGKYCDLQAELEQINDDLDEFYRWETKFYYTGSDDVNTTKTDRVRKEKKRQKVLEKRLRIFQKEFSDRTDKLQANINKFEEEVNDFVEKMQGELTNRQLLMLIDNSAKNKVDLEKYFKQYHNQNHELTQMLWQMPKYYVTGNEGVVMGFNKDGYLVALFDNYENQTAIVYEKGRISSIQDTDNNVTSFEYGKQHRINKIITADAKTYHLEYEQNKGLLTKIIDANGEETRLGYDSYGFLNSVEDNDGFGVAFSYDMYGRVIEVKQTSKITSVTDEGIAKSKETQSKALASINYHDTYLTTSVTNEKDVTTTYNFDILGKVVTMYEGKYDDPNETTKAKSFEYVDNQKSFSISENLFGSNLLANPTKIVLEGTKNNTAQAAVKSIEVKLPQDGTTDYVFSVWAKADSAYVESARSMQYTDVKLNERFNITNDEKKRNRKFEVRAEVSYEEDNHKDTFVAGFDWLNIDWQYIALPIEINPNKTLVKCVVMLDYSYNSESAQFSCMSLRQGVWTYSEFDDEGKKISSEDSTGKTVTEYEYDDKGRLIKEILTYKSDENLPEEERRRFVSTKEYNAKGSLVRSINYAGVVEETVFDDKGRELKKITYNLDDPSSKFYEESKRDDKGTITADVDESGEYDAVTYTYDQNGEVAVQTDGKGNKTAFGYKDGVQVSISGSADGQESKSVSHHTASLLTKVTNGDTTYNYEYDAWGRSTHVKIAGSDFAISTEYTDELHTTSKFADMVVTSENDVYGNTKKQIVKYGNKLTQSVENTYDAETQKLTNSAIDIGGGKKYNIGYEYDHKGNTVKEERGGQFGLIKENVYNTDNDLQSTVYTVSGKMLEYTYETDHTPDKRDAKIGLPCNLQQVLAYDGLGRTKEVALGQNLVKDIYYAKFGDHATNRINSVWHGVNGIRKDNTRYTYDKTGNIETVTDNGELVARYTYDGLNRLIREDNVHFGTFTYQYDPAGNILSKKSYEFTTAETLGKATSVNEYSYKQSGWKDQLLSFNGERFAYDVMGNPTVYRDRTLEWQGRRLVKYTKDTKSATYTYDFNGVRTSKTLSDGKRTDFVVNYIYDGNNLIAEQRGTKWITYFYGVDGVAGFEYDNNTYLYRKNVQGDVTHIYKKLNDGKLELVAQYVYDAWGNHKVFNAEGVEVQSTEKVIANMNPFRYRSYYFDIETQLYYLQTRYYDAAIGRFISADSIEYLEPETLGGLNLYAYCGNNPIMAVDPEGTAWWHWLVGGILLVAAITLAIVTCGASMAVTAAAAAGIECTLSAATIGLASISSIAVGAAVAGVGAAAVGLVTSGIQEDGSWNWDKAAEGFMWGAIGGVVCGAAGAAFGTAGAIVSSCAMNAVQQLATTGEINPLEVAFAGLFAGVSQGFGLTKFINNIYIGNLLRIFGDVGIGIGFGAAEYVANNYMKWWQKIKEKIMYRWAK